MKKFMASLLLSAVVFTAGVLTAFAEGTGWIEVLVNVPEGFTDQIYVEFRDVNQNDDPLAGHAVQILPENGYIGRIKLPVGTYEITMKQSFENPFIYDLQLTDDTVYPIAVNSSDTATLVKLDCDVFAIEDLPDIEGEYPKEILDAAQLISDENAQQESEPSAEENVESTDILPSADSEEQNVSAEGKGPLYRIITGFLSTVVFVGSVGGLGYFVYKTKIKHQ